VKIAISTPKLWFHFREKIAMYLVGCLKRRNVDAKLADFGFIAETGLTDMFIRSADFTNATERLMTESCVSAIGHCLSTSVLDPFLDCLREFSANDKRELEALDVLLQQIG
jgi:hypothetical protein